MKKFYIPTSTLNFNNILSSESISPKVFYDKRGFGYSRWMTIPEDSFANVIVLYDNLCFFERPKSDIEDHPLLIEVLLDETQLKQTDGFWYCDHTIYLAPNTTRFLFYTETDKTITLSMSESSLETKLIRLYAKQINTIQKPSNCYKPIESSEPCALNESEIEKDVRINKMKGMLYGYYIGSLLSSDSESVKYLNVLKEIHNIFAAILSSFEKKPTAYQSERLDVLFDYLNERNADYLRLYEMINSSTLDAKNKAKTVWSWIFSRKDHLQNEDKSFWLSCLQYVSEKDERENSAISWIKRKIEEAKRQIQANRHFLSPTDGELVVVDNKVSMLKNTNLINDTEIRLCISWLNETLSEKNTNGKISTYKEELAKNLTLKAKEVYQELWEGSPTRTYLNDLRRHLAGEEFNHDWNNGLLSSIASVLIAGDDWEKMLAFMQNKEMTDYKLAFSFYGALNGFANLTRDFTDVLYNQEKNYIWSVYKEFYRQIYGNDIPSVVENGTSLIPSDARPIKANTISEIGNADNLANPQIRAIVNAIEAHPKFNPKKHQEACSKILNEGISDWDNIIKLCKWKGIIEEVRKGLDGSSSVTKKRRGKKESIATPNLFNAGQDAEPSNEHAQWSIIFDRNAGEVINRCPSLLPQIKKSVLKLFRDFQKSYQSGYYSMNSEQYKRNNSDVINHFNKWCFSQKNKEALPWTEENSNSMDELKQYLLHYYCD